MAEDTNGTARIRHILELKDDMHEMELRLINEIGKVRVDVSALKVKAGIWGSIAGLATAIGVILLKALF